MFQVVNKTVGFYHVGVRAPNGQILELTTTDGKLAQIKTVQDDGKWKANNGYQQVGDDADVVKRWNFVVELWNKIKAMGKEQLVKYNVYGEMQQGLSCENVAGFVLTGDPAPRLGVIARALNKYAGLDISSLGEKYNASRSNG